MKLSKIVSTHDKTAFNISITGLLVKSLIFTGSWKVVNICYLFYYLNILNTNLEGHILDMDIFEKITSNCTVYNMRWSWFLNCFVLFNFGANSEIEIVYDDPFDTCTLFILKLGKYTPLNERNGLKFMMSKWGELPYYWAFT